MMGILQVSLPASMVPGCQGDDALLEGETKPASAGAQVAFPSVRGHVKLSAISVCYTEQTS